MPIMPMKRCVLQIKVTGRVQGVGFRAYVKARADEVGVFGWVRNLADGSVHVLAFLPEERRSSWIESVRRGPPGSMVDSLDIRNLSSEEVPGLSDLREFRIERDAE
jgi:acylphosphatase